MSLIKVSSFRTMAQLNGFHMKLKKCSIGLFFFSLSSFGPYLAKRCCTSALVNPLAMFVSSLWRTSSKDPHSWCS